MNIEHSSLYECERKKIIVDKHFVFSEYLQKGQSLTINCNTGFVNFNSLSDSQVSPRSSLPDSQESDTQSCSKAT
jgi:hypothetical protein